MENSLFFYFTPVSLIPIIFSNSRTKSIEMRHTTVRWRQVGGHVQFKLSSAHCGNGDGCVCTILALVFIYFFVSGRTTAAAILNLHVARIYNYKLYTKMFTRKQRTDRFLQTSVTQKKPQKKKETRQTTSNASRAPATEPKKSKLAKNL